MITPSPLQPRITDCCATLPVDLLRWKETNKLPVLQAYMTCQVLAGP